MGDRISWSVSKAKTHYRLDKWNMGFFDINSKGNIIVKSESHDLDLFELIQDLKEKGINTPVLVRFPHILQEIITKIYSEFQAAIKASNYAGNYIAAYPIKVNQQATVIQHLHDQTQWPIAFEVGSKAELLACLGILQRNNQTIICNGYKDQSYIRLALLGCMLGHKVIIVLESIHELNYVLEQSAELEIEPILGMRVRLSSIAEGNWQNTGGQFSKFGLTTNEVLALVNALKNTHSLARMKMLHFHMGSQIPCLQDIQLGIKEAMRYFSELTRIGIEFKMLNVGGGLAIDYEGDSSDSYFSRDYSIKQYASTIIDTVNSICRKNKLKSPTIYTENGRAMTAHHAVLITNVIDAEYKLQMETFKSCNDYTNNQKLDLLHKLISEISMDISSPDASKSLSGKYNALFEQMKLIEQDFLKGRVSLQEKAYAEAVVNHAYDNIYNAYEELDSEYKQELEEKLVDKYFCNFSLFQSTPDIWGLRQIFPILPLHRLNEFPNRKVHIHDLTCDSDGQIGTYVENNSIKPYLSLHEFYREDDYYIGLFLVGAYQEILGDLHNLFGDTYAVNIEFDSDGTYQIYEEEPGDTIEDVLSYVHINSDDMRRTWLYRLGDMNIHEHSKKLLLQELETALQQNSYLN